MRQERSGAGQGLSCDMSHQLSWNSLLTEQMARITVTSNKITTKCFKLITNFQLWTNLVPHFSFLQAKLKIYVKTQNEKNI